MFRAIFAAGTIALLCGTALAGDAGEILKATLYGGAHAEGLGKLETLAAGGDNEAAFGVGAIKLTQTFEHFVQTLYLHGFDAPRAGGLTEAIPSLPVNPNPAPFDYDGVRVMLSDLVSGLDAARGSFDAAAQSGDYVIELNPLLIRIDADGDGVAREGETLAGIVALLSGTTVDQLLAEPAAGEPPKPGIVGFDRADAYWLAGYTQVLAAQGDFLLAHDFSGFVNTLFHRIFPRAGFPMQDFSHGGRLLLDPESDPAIADAIAAIHEIRWPVTDPAKLAGVRGRLKSVVAYSRRNWDAILSETDDRFELVPSPQQTPMFPGTRVDDTGVAAWRATLDEADRILDGTLLIPHWRFTQGFDLRAYFETAKVTDLVLMLSGYGALPFLREGPVANAGDFREIQDAFGSDWLGYAFWFN